MSHLEEAQNNMGIVAQEPTEADETLQKRLRRDAKAHALIAIAEQLVIQNKLKFFELKGNKDFKLKPDDVLEFLELGKDK